MRSALVAAALVGPALSLTALSGCDSHDSGGQAAPAAQQAAGDRSVAAGGGLDGCSVVTTRLLHDDLGLGLTAAGQSTPSFFGDAGVTDCDWFVDAVTVSVYATSQAGQDLPEGAIDGYLQSGGAAVPGADRGVAYATSNADGSNVDLIVVKGQLGIELAASSPDAMTQAQALTLGQHVLAGLG